MRAAPPTKSRSRVCGTHFAPRRLHGSRKRPAAEPAATGKRQKPLILVVEDDEDARMVLTELLRPRYDVDAVGDGETALKRAAELKPDLVLLDLFLPGMDGFGALTGLRRNSKTADTPVIFLSAQGDAETKCAGALARRGRLPGEALQRAGADGARRSHAQARRAEGALPRAGADRRADRACPTSAPSTRASRKRSRARTATGIRWRARWSISTG